MKCPYCGQQNDNDFIFCVNCGKSIANAGSYDTVFVPPAGDETEYPSVQTAFARPVVKRRRADDKPVLSFADVAEPKKNRLPLYIGASLIILMLVGGGAVAAYFLVNRPTTPAEVLPGHLGMFVRNSQTKALTEIKKAEHANALTAKDAILKDTTLQVVESKPDVIFYAENSETPVGEIKLVPLETIAEDGKMKQIDYQVSLIESNAAMKRLRLPESLAVGKYAFVHLSGYFDEGRHKFWPFEVRTAERASNDQIAKDTLFALKPKAIASSTKTDTSKQTGTTESNSSIDNAPVGAKVAYCNSTNVVVRSSPSLKARKVNALRKNQKVYVIRYSDNTDSWNGLQSNWAFIQTENGKQGWVFTPFISY
jgi:hypothetical protein